MLKTKSNYKVKKVDVIFVKPGSQKELYGELSDFELTAIEPPLWGAILASYLRESGYSVVLFDAEVEGWSYEETVSMIKEVNSLLVVICVSGTNPSASTMNMEGANKILSRIKQEKIPTKTMLWGLHPSALPELTISEEAVDFVCQGEGFYTIPKVIDAVKNSDSSYTIEGLWYKKDEVIVSNPRPKVCGNLDELPMPAWDLLPMKKYRAHNWHCFGDIENRHPYAVIYTSLGCPFKCTFCCINSLFGKNTIRYRSVSKVIHEIEYLVDNYNIRNIKIIDEMFALNEKRICELCDAIIQRKYKLNMWAYARVDTVTERMLSKMKEAGINWVAYGFESGSKRVIEDIHKGYKTEKLQESIDMTYGQDMHICANYIFGLPEDDYVSMNETLKLMLDINAEWSNIYSAMAYPGSRLYDDAVKSNWQLPDNWQSFSQYAIETIPLPTKYLNGGQVLAFRDYAFDVYYNNPRYLNMIARKFSEETARHIKEMASHKIKRKFLQNW